MNNPMDYSNFWLALVVIVTAIAIMTYAGPAGKLTGAATGGAGQSSEVFVNSGVEEFVYQIELEGAVIEGTVPSSGLEFEERRGGENKSPVFSTW